MVINLLPMKALKATLQKAGFKNVSTYIQSGNIVLSSSQNPEEQIASLIKHEFGFHPAVLAITKTAFETATLNNPFQEYEGKYVHVYFCKDTPNLNAQKLASVVADTEECRLVGNVFYIHAPQGIARSKLVANVEKCLGVAATGRNLNTAQKLTQMLKMV